MIAVVRKGRKRVDRGRLALQGRGSERKGRKGSTYVMGGHGGHGADTFTPGGKRIGGHDPGPTQGG